LPRSSLIDALKNLFENKVMRAPGRVWINDADAIVVPATDLEDSGISAVRA
jgi:hypothetical protein